MLRQNIEELGHITSDSPTCLETSTTAEVADSVNTLCAEPIIAVSASFSKASEHAIGRNFRFLGPPCTAFASLPVWTWCHCARTGADSCGDQSASNRN